MAPRLININGWSLTRQPQKLEVKKWKKRSVILILRLGMLFHFPPNRFEDSIIWSSRKNSRTHSWIWIYIRERDYFLLYIDFTVVPRWPSLSLLLSYPKNDFSVKELQLSFSFLLFTSTLSLLELKNVFCWALFAHLDLVSNNPFL